MMNELNNFHNFQFSLYITLNNKSKQFLQMMYLFSRMVDFSCFRIRVPIKSIINSYYNGHYNGIYLL
jgi:hypothetical protein